MIMHSFILMAASSVKWCVLVFHVLLIIILWVLFCIFFCLVFVVVVVCCFFHLGNFFCFAFYSSSLFKFLPKKYFEIECNEMNFPCKTWKKNAGKRCSMSNSNKKSKTAITKSTWLNLFHSILRLWVLLKIEAELPMQWNLNTVA